MKKIDVSQIVDPSIQQPFTGLSLEFLQNGNSEMVFAICQSLIKRAGYTYSNSVPYLINSVSLPSFTSDGCIFFNGELYVMGENVSGDQYAILDTTPDSVADPLLFTDGINRNVHNNRYLTFQSSATGALFDLNDVVNINTNNPFASITPEATGDYTVPSTVNTYANVLQMRKNRFSNDIEFRGCVQKGTVSGSGSTVIYNLPVGGRPTNVKAFTVAETSGGSRMVYVNPTGAVTCAASDNDVISLDQVKFSLD